MFASKPKASEKATPNLSNQEASPSSTPKSPKSPDSIENQFDSDSSTPKPRRRFVYNRSTAYTQFTPQRRPVRRNRAYSTQNTVSNRYSESYLDDTSSAERKLISSFAQARKDVLRKEYSDDDAIVYPTPEKDYFRNKMRVQQVLATITVNPSSVPILESDDDTLPILTRNKGSVSDLDQIQIAPAAGSAFSTDTSDDVEEEYRNAFSNIDIEGSYSKYLRKSSQPLQFDATDPNVVTFLGGFRSDLKGKDNTVNYARRFARSKRLLSLANSQDSIHVEEKVQQAIARVPIEVNSLDPLSWKSNNNGTVKFVRFESEPNIREVEVDSDGEKG